MRSGIAAGGLPHAGVAQRHQRYERQVDGANGHVQAAAEDADTGVDDATSFG